MSFRIPSAFRSPILYSIRRFRGAPNSRLPSARIVSTPDEENISARGRFHVRRDLTEVQLKMKQNGALARYELVRTFSNLAIGAVVSHQVMNRLFGPYDAFVLALMALGLIVVEVN